MFEDQMDQFRFSCTLLNVHIMRWAFYDWQKYMIKSHLQSDLEFNGALEKLIANELYHGEFLTVLIGILIDYLLASRSHPLRYVKVFMSNGITTNRLMANLGQLRLVGYCLKVTNLNNYTESVKKVLRDYLVSDDDVICEIDYGNQTRNPARLFFASYIFSAIRNLELETLQALLNFGAMTINKPNDQKKFLRFCKNKYDTVTTTGLFDLILVELITRNRERFPARMIDYMREVLIMPPIEKFS